MGGDAAAWLPGLQDGDLHDGGPHQGGAGAGGGRAGAGPRPRLGLVLAGGGARPHPQPRHAHTGGGSAGLVLPRPAGNTLMMLKWMCPDNRSQSHNKYIICYVYVSIKSIQKIIID